MDAQLLQHRRTIWASAPGAQKLFAAVRLLPTPAAVETRARPAIAVAVDTSGSMYQKVAGRSAKIDVAIDVVGEIPLVPGFRAGTEISLIQFDTDASVLLPLSVLAENGQQVMESHAKRLRQFNGGTDLARALELALDQLDNASEGTVRRIVVVTDGETVDEDRCRLIAGQAAERGVGIFCVGIGDEYREDFLLELAERTRGGVAHVDDGEDSRVKMRHALRQELIAAQRQTLTNGLLTVQCGLGVWLERVDQVYPRCLPLPESTSSSYVVGGAAEADESVFLLDMQIGELPNEIGADLRIADIALEFTRIDTGERVSWSSPVFLTPVADSAAARAIDKDVMFYVRQRNIAGLVDDAARQSRLGDARAAKKSLLDARRITNLIGHHQMDRRIAGAERELDDRGEIRAATQKDLKVTSRMGTLNLLGLGRPEGDA